MAGMPRVPCSFSAQQEFLARVDARALQLGMKRSEYIVHALRHELLSEGHSMSVVAEQSGTGNTLNQKFRPTSYREAYAAPKRRKEEQPPKSGVKKKMNKGSGIG